MCLVMHDLLNDLAKYVWGTFVYVGSQRSTRVFGQNLSFLDDRYDVSKRFDALHEANSLLMFLPLR